MIRTTRRVDREVERLREHFERKRYLNAIRSLDAALVEAKRMIGENPTVGAPLLRPYPDPRLSRPGQLWFKVGRYWCRHTTTPPLTITAWFHETGNIPLRDRG